MNEIPGAPIRNFNKIWCVLCEKGRWQVWWGVMVSIYLSRNIRKTCPYNFDPLKPHFYIVKLGFTRVYIIVFLFLLKNIDCGYSLEPPQWGGSNDCLQSMFWAEIWNISEFVTENFQFLVTKFSIYLNRRVFVWRQKTYLWPCAPSEDSDQPAYLRSLISIKNVKPHFWVSKGIRFLLVFVFFSFWITIDSH